MTTIISLLALRRIEKELKDLEKHTDPSCKLELVRNSINNLTGQIVGPKGTPYEGGTYKLSFEIPGNYPLSSPKVKFITKIWHPNISSITGHLKILKKLWTPNMTLRTVMLSLQSLLSAPQLGNPVDAIVAVQYEANKEDFERTAQYWAHKYAGAKPSDPNIATCDDLVKKMMGMGFSDEGSVKSLSESNWNIDSAINSLL